MRKQPTKKKIPPRKSDWKQWVDTNFDTIKVCYGKIPPAPKSLDEDTEYSDFLASSILPYGFTFRIQLPFMGECDIETDALVKAIWKRLFGTPKGRKMLRDAFSKSICKDGIKALSRAQVSIGNYEDIDEKEPLLFYCDGADTYSFKKLREPEDLDWSAQYQSEEDE